ncbi:hypothetical protein BEN35_16180 [Streptomyces fradiae]|nr:hypothetical protein BEN35_16180 [Streptomyces fradiae]
MPPPATTAAARRSASSPLADTGPPAARHAARGPHSGQASGSAWKRRSAGSAYSAAHRAQSGKPRIVVRSRSYGRSSMTVARGPQSVQLMKG